MREPFVAGDGYLVRLGLAGGSISAGQLLAFAEAAGPDALIEVTNRSNLQVRRLDSAAWERVIDCAELFGRADDDRSGRVIADPLFGPSTGLLDITPVVDAVAERLRSLPSLSAKFGVVIDSGGPVHVRGRGASVALGAVVTNGDVRFEVALGSSLDEHVIGTIAIADAADAVADAAQGDTPRACDVSLRYERRNITRSEAVGTHVPLGRQPVGWWTGFAGSFPPDTELRVTTRGSVVAIGDEGATDDDPARSVVTCIGSQGCEYGNADTLRDATELIDTLRATETTLSARIHLSGCGKQCASRESNDIHLIATDRRYEIA